MAQFGFPIPPEALSGLAEAFKGDISSIPQLGVTVEVSGMEQIRKNLHYLNEKMVADAVEECRRLAEYLKAESQKEVPYKTGNLHDSAFIHEDDDAILKGFLVGYDAITVQYAWYVHEIPANHAPGKKDHFLSDPAERLAAEFPDVMRQRLSDSVAKAAATFQRGSLGAGIGGPRLVKRVQ